MFFFSRCFFLLFVFLIVVVLMNLLNGLAVSDTGLVREKAEIVAHTSRAAVIAQIEATLLGGGGTRLSCGLRRRALARLLTGSRNILLFYSALPDKRLTVFPNRGEAGCGGWLGGGAVGREVLRAARDLVLRLAAGNGEVDRVMQDLQDRQERLETKLDKILLSLDSIVDKVDRKL